MRAAALLLAVLLGASSAWAVDDIICQTHLVQSGDSIWSIANTYGVQPEDLTAALQQCVGYTGNLQIGQRICLPGWVPACDYVTDSGDVPNCKTYQLQQGDTIASIASTFGIYAQDLAALNADIISGVLQVGKFIRLPPWNDAACPDPDSDAASCRVYAVQAGDFVFGISSIFRVSMADLLTVNPGLQSNTLLQAGQRVRIPPFTAACGNGVYASPPTTGVFSCRAYKVKSGDSLASIALLFQTTTASLIATNPELSNPALLQPGKIVKIAPYPGECVNGILIDPKSSAAATPAGPISAPVPSTIPSPSPSPAAIPSPSPSPVVASPSPSPAASPSPSPGPATTTLPAPSTGVRATLTLTGVNPTAFSAKAAQFAGALAIMLNVPGGAAWVTVRAAAAPTRRLQAAGEATYLTVLIASADPAATASKLQALVASGALTSALSQLGLYISPNSLSVSTFPAPSTTTPTTTAGGVAPAPAPAPVAAAGSAGGKKSNVGAIVGGVVGGVGGAAVVCGLVWVIVRKRRAAAAAAAGAGSLRSAYMPGATAQVTTTSGLSVKTAAGRLKELDTGVSSSPRNNATPRTRVGQMA